VDDSIVTDPFCTIKPTSLRSGRRLDKISADRHRGQRERRVPQSPRSTTRLEVGLLRDVVGIYVNGLLRVPGYPCFKPPAFEWRGLDPLVLLFQLLSTFNPFRRPPVFLRYGSTPWSSATFTLRGDRRGNVIRPSLFSPPVRHQPPL
jgi:hypothetical protein